MEYKLDRLLSLYVVSSLSCMRKYTDAKSTLVKDLIKETEFKDRAKIDELLELEHFILYGPKGFWSEKYFEDLKGRYSNEYAEMYKELRPEDYQRKLDEEREEKERADKEKEFWRRKEEQLEKEEREDWEDAGGKS